MASGTLLTSPHFLDESIFTNGGGGTGEADSPPSLTNSSESPASLSDHSSPQSSNYTLPNQQQQQQQQQQQYHQQSQQQFHQQHHNPTSPMGSVVSAKSPVNGSSRDDASVSWHTPGAHGSIARSPSDAIDSLMSGTSFAAAGGEAWEQTSTQFDQLDTLTGGWGRGAPASLADFNAVPGVDVGREVQLALSRGGGLDAWAANASQSIGQNGWDSRDNDEAMFDSLIQEDSFGPASAATSDHGDESPQSDSKPLAAQFESLTVPSPNGLPASALSFTHQEAHQPMHSQQSSSSSVTMSSSQADAAAARRAKALPTNLSSKSDAELPFSATNIVRPPREELRNLQVHIHGIPLSGAKSRVETQIRTRIELVRPASGAGPSIQQQTGGIGSDAWERIASFTHIKLPPLSSTKRKSKKAKGSPDAVPERTLFVDATVVNATAPHSRVLVCSGCRTRERKRALRKREAAEIPPSADEMLKMGIDPKSKGAAERAMARLEEDEKQRIVLFNCGEYVEFADGACVLPTRITCYCRHHQEKIGFCIIFTMRDWQGNVVATGSTPPILITDDHKSAAAHQAAANAAAAKADPKAKASSSSTAQVISGPVKQVDGSRTSRSNSTEADATVAGRARKGSNARKTVRAKPYGDAPDRSTRRSTNGSSSGLVMTPYSGTGNNTPATAERPLHSLGLSRNGSLGGNSAPEGSRTPADAASPASATSRNSVASPAAWLAAGDGSLSPSTLATLPQSMPTFDFEGFLRDAGNGQAGSLMALAEVQQAQQMQFQQQQQQLGAFPSSLPMPPPGFDASVPQQPVPHISKLIPGEGPTSGGIEVTILGENFVDGVVCVFGDVQATNTRVWASNTLVCILPPSCSPGPVVVDIKGANGAPAPDGRPLQLFTYVDTSDRALMELALQVVGLQMTGQMQSARDVAMRVVGSNGNGASGSGTTSGQQPQGYQAQSVARDAVSGLFATGSASARGESQSFQDSVLGFLSLLDVELSADDLPEGRAPRKDAIRLGNKQGHTLLHLSVMLGFHRLVAALLKRGCPPNARDHNGYTPLHFAASLGRMTIARMLLSHGARDDLPNALGNLPIDVAREKEQLDVEMLLEEQTSSAAQQILQARQAVYGVLQDSGVSLSDRSSEIDADNVSTGFDDSADFSSSSEDDEESSEQASGSSGDERTPRETPGMVTPQRATAASISFPPDVKTQLPDESAPSVSEKPDAKLADEKAPRTAPSSPSLPTPTSQAKAKAAEASSETSLNKAVEAVSNVNDASYGALRALLAGEFGDFAQKLQLPAVMPAIHDRIMPAIAVFHLALPNGGNLRAWATRGNNAGTASAEGSARLDGNAEDQEPNKLMTMWGKLVEDSPLWKSKDTKASPPPSYESVAGERAAFASAEAGSSRLPSISRPSSRTSHHKSRAARAAEEMGRAPSPRTPSGGASMSRSNSGTRHHVAFAPLSASTSALPAEQSSSTTSRRSRRGAPSAAAPAPGTAASRRVRNLRDDAMLLYFWLPALVVVLLVFLYASTTSSDSVLSLADLYSYLPSVPDATTRAATTASASATAPLAAAAEHAQA